MPSTSLFDRISPEALVACLVLMLILNFARGIAGMYLDRKDRGRIVEAASSGCNYPIEMVAPLRDAVTRQTMYAEGQLRSTAELREHIGQLIVAMNVNTGKLIEALTEIRASQRIQR